MTAEEEIYSRAKAAFLGVALGDALGATTEFMTVAEIKARFKVHRKIIGRGWLRLRPGQVTDDTEMSLALARAILEGNAWDIYRIADNFVAWMRGKPIDIGSTVRKGIRTYMCKGTTKMPRNDWDAGNGAAMRMVPVTLYSLGDDTLLKRTTLEQARLTHNHALSDAGCLCIGRMTQAAIMGADRFQLHAITRDLVGEYPNFNFNKYKGVASGYIVDTLQTVFHHLFTTSSFEECLTGIVNQGGDADTTGAIGGMIAGAHYGLESLPKRWVKKLDKSVYQEINEISGQLVALSPWAKSQTS